MPKRMLRAVARAAGWSGLCWLPLCADEFVCVPEYLAMLNPAGEPDPAPAVADRSTPAPSDAHAQGNVR